jgi:arabinosaccharide transport system substrate-binding protein
MMTEQGAAFQDNSDPDDPKPTVDNPALLKAIETQQSWLNDGIAMACPGGQPDTEEGKAWIAPALRFRHHAEWYMSRFVDEIPDMAGKYAIPPAGFEQGQPPPSAWAAPAPS